MRIFYLDVVKAVAILLVLLCHATSVVPYTEHNLFPMCTDYQIAQLCNGLFIIASGALVLPSQIERGYPMCWRRVLKFLLLAAFWSIATNSVYYCIMDGMPLRESVCQAVARNNFILNGGAGAAGQMWFISIISCLYLAAPYMAKMVDGMPLRRIVLFVLIGMLLYLIPGTLNYDGEFHSVLNPDTQYLWVRYDFFGVYAGWFLVGYAFRVHGDKIEAAVRKVVPYPVTAGILFVALAATAAGYAESRALGDRMMFHPSFQNYYSSLSLYVNSIVLFYVLKNLADRLLPMRRIVEYLSLHSFSIFLIHMCFLFPWLRLVFDTELCSNYPWVVIAAGVLVLLVASLLLIHIISLCRVGRFWLR